MKINSIKFKGHRCFKDEWVGFDSVKPINVIIGRNNSGKSHIIDLVRKCCFPILEYTNTEFKYTSTLDQESLVRHFSKDSSGGGLTGNHWLHHGKRFVGQKIEWQERTNREIAHLRTTQSDLIDPDNMHECFQEYLARVARIAANASHELSGSEFRHLSADRDLIAESAVEKLSLSPSGAGATNIVRRCLTSSDPACPRELIQIELLDCLNAIFGEDGDFNEITIQLHDFEGVEERNVWEIYLGERHKGIVPLSKSGSGLKTVILVLLNLLVIPHIEKSKRSKYVFAMEELENNLHPALLRRLFQFIEHYTVKHGAKFFLTTHSSVALDFFGLSNNAQITHVKHNGVSANASIVAAHFDKVGIVAELGAKPSDLLQANGIVWVEGPSDRIYINRWIEIVSKGELQEGRDYQCAFYGGALLARTEFASPEEEQSERNRVNLLRVNPNVILICDGDRSGPKAKIKDRVRRLSGEVRKIPRSGFWATKGREIENYLPGLVMEGAMDRKNIPDPDQYESFFPRIGAKSESFIEKHLNRKTLDKTQFAISCARFMDFENMKDRFDWRDNVERLVKLIREWNR